ncbi:MAG: sugar ABC transporter permease [Chloroflexota bacterium]|nr:MAG: sugar ABC transporter permease [Chloroflexota bacterium]
MTKKLSLTPYLFLAPALTIIAVFILYPALAVFYYSFTDYNIVQAPKWVGFENYQNLVSDPIFWKALLNSFLYLIVTPILIVLSILLAIAVNRPLPGINAFRALYYVPVISGTIAVGIAWRWLFDYNGGLINGILVGVGILEQPVQWLADPALTLPIAMLLTIWIGLGYYMMVFLAGLQNISEDLYDAAAIDGCNAFQKHWYITIPGLRPQIVFIAVISSLAAIEVFNEIYILTGGLGGILNCGVTMVFYLWRQAFRLQHAGYASAIAMVLLLITLAFSIINIRLLERSGQSQ